MAYPVTELISEAFYTSGIVSREFQTVAGDQVITGLLKLNEILSDTAIETDMLPYYTTSYKFFSQINTEMYFIPNLDQCETLVFYLDTVRYQMRKNPRDQYFGQGRAQNVQSLPFNWHVERTLGGSNLFIYFFPDQDYPMEITGLFRLQSVVLGQDLNSALATANLGVPIVTGTGNFAAGELIVNDIDLAGTYAQPIDLVNYINTGVIPFVSADLSTGQFILTNISGTNINIVSNGSEGTVNNVTFSNFSTVNGYMNQTFMPIALDQFYINYLQYYLADRLCTAYNFELPMGAAKQLLRYQQMISKRSSPMDLTMNKLSTLQTQSSINYGQVNIGRGFCPP